MIEGSPLGGQQDHRAGRLRTKHALHGGEDRLGLHHHPAAAAVRLVVGGAVLVGCVVPDVVQGDLQHAGLAGALEDALIQVSGEHFREEGKDVESHGVILSLEAGARLANNIKARKNR